MSDNAAVAAETGRHTGWLSSLETHGVQFLVLDRQRDSHLLQFIRSQPGWAVDFEDQEGVLFVRKEVSRDEYGASTR